MATTSKHEMNGSAERVQKAAKAVKAELGPTVDNLMERTQEVVKRIEPEVRAAADSAVQFVRRHPVACLIGAVAVGFGIVALSRRSKD